jgi:hypothetical protein
MILGRVPRSGRAGPRRGDLTGHPPWGALGAVLAGDVLFPSSPAYEAARTPAIARFAHVRPRASVRCAAPSDVTQALTFTRRYLLTRDRGWPPQGGAPG